MCHSAKFLSSTKFTTAILYISFSLVTCTALAYNRNRVLVQRESEFSGSQLRDNLAAGERLLCCL